MGRQTLACSARDSLRSTFSMAVYACMQVPDITKCTCFRFYQLTWAVPGAGSVFEFGFHKGCRSQNCEEEGLEVVKEESDV